METQEILSIITTLCTGIATIIYAWKGKKEG